ncbi:MAG: hypothetical protein JWO95_2865 [Verrucomicrobiales bacterium]|nr:hypothetical protein [Verrucomicrobiales bacterium]
MKIENAMENQLTVGTGLAEISGVNRPSGNRNSWVRDVVPWDEPVNGAELLDELTATVRRFVVLPNCGAEAMALWILHTYAFELRDVSTYVGIESPEKRCGKTTLLGLLSELVNRPVVAANISSPAFFRVIEETKPTLLIDEADTFLQGNDELRGILNSGYAKKTAFVVRMANEALARGHRASAFEPIPDEQQNNRISNPNVGIANENRKSSESSGMRLARFSSWCPKAVAAIGRLPETLADRCIVMRMQRKMVAEKCERLKSLDGEILRRKCARFVQDHAEEIQSAQPTIPEALNDRAADIWEPLFVLADIASDLNQQHRKADGKSFTEGNKGNEVMVESPGAKVEGQKNGIAEDAAGGGAPGEIEHQLCTAVPVVNKKSWAVIARDAALGLTAATQQAHPIGSLLLDVKLAFMTKDREKMFSRDIVEVLLLRKLRPWTEMTRGREINEFMLAQILRRYGVRTRTVWIDGQSAKGYVRSDFEELFSRYIPQSEFEALREEIMPESQAAAYERRNELARAEAERRRQEAELRAMTARTGNMLKLLGKL